MAQDFKWGLNLIFITKRIWAYQPTRTTFFIEILQTWYHHLNCAQTLKFTASKEEQIKLWDIVIERSISYLATECVCSQLRKMLRNTCKSELARQQWWHDDEMRRREAHSSCWYCNKSIWPFDDTSSNPNFWCDIMILLEGWPRLQCPGSLIIPHNHPRKKAGPSNFANRGIALLVLLTKTTYSSQGCILPTKQFSFSICSTW